VFTYDGSFPGPTIEVESGTPVFAEFPNQLPGQHILPIDRSVCGNVDPRGRAVVHLHGGHQGWASDGNAFAWTNPNGTGVGPDWRSPISYYPNDRPAGLLWYHDHAACITRLNVRAQGRGRAGGEARGREESGRRSCCRWW
jgi:spore coat protein A, manganese oxidase